MILVNREHGKVSFRFSSLFSRWLTAGMRCRLSLALIIAVGWTGCGGGGFGDGLA
jgi:hypothetical protein